MAKINTTLFGELALIPYVAEIPVTETLSYLTDQMESWNGTEQNVQLRSKPRQTFQYTIPLKQEFNPEVFNTAYGALRNKWAIPVWPDLQYVGNVAAGASSIVCNVVDYDLRDSSLAMVFDGCGKWQILEISTVAAGYINFAGTITVALNGAYLVPVRVGYISGSLSKPFNGYTGRMEVSFDVDDLKEFTGTVPEQYLGFDLYTAVGLLDSNSRPVQIVKRDDVIDFDLGLVERRSPWTRAKVGASYRNVSVTPAERTAFRNFIYRRLGKSRQFWMPTFENNIRLKNTGTVVSTLVAWKDSYLDYGTARVHVAIEAGGVWYPRIISAPVATDATTMQLTLSSPLNIPASSISRVSYLGLNRLDTDSVEFNYNTSLTVEANVRILELAP